MCDSRVIGLINALTFLFSPLTVLLIYRPLTVVQFLPSLLAIPAQIILSISFPSICTLPLSPALSRTLPHSPALSRTLPFIIHSCVQSSPNTSSCFHPYFIFFLTFLIPFVLLTPILASRHLTSKWRSTCTIYDTPSSSPPKKKNKAKQSKTKKNKQKQQESILT